MRARITRDMSGVTLTALAGWAVLSCGAAARHETAPPTSAAARHLEEWRRSRTDVYMNDVVKSSGGLDFELAISAAPPVKGALNAKIAADLNNDGAQDLISITTWLSASPPSMPDGVYLSLGIGNGTFVDGEMVAGTADATSVVLGDLNGDSKPDLLVTFATGDKTFYGDGAGHFAAAP
jgi:FG-GAP-like repeat